MSAAILLRRCAVLIALAAAARGGELESGRILRIVSDLKVHASDLRPGRTLRGEFRSAVYSRDRVAIPAGSTVDLTIGRPVKRKGPSVWKRIGLSLAGRSARARVQHAASVNSATLSLSSGTAVPITVDVVDVFSQVSVRPKSGPNGKEPKRFAIILKLKEPLSVADSAPVAQFADNGAVAAGARGRAILLAPVSASGNHDGDKVQTRLAEPLVADGRIAFPEGTLLDAVMVRRKPPRSFSRSGAFGLSIRQAVIPDSGNTFEVSAVLGSAESGGTTRLDAEGTLSGGRRSKKRAALDLAISYVAGKVVDDLLEEGVKAIWGAAVSGTAATAARYVGLATGALVFFGQPGRDVYLPQYSEIELVFSRPVAR